MYMYNKGWYIIVMAYQYNIKAVYPQEKRYVNETIRLVKQVIYVKGAGSWFNALFPNIFENYLIKGIRSEKVIQSWNSNPMQFWQNQLHFAIWCATTGCGVSMNDHLNVKDPFARAIFRFHAYYQIRRILTEIQAPLPQDRAWSATNNPYDRRGYEKICNEFGVRGDWRREGPNHGLGTPIQWFHKPVVRIGGSQSDAPLRHPSDRVIPIKQESDDALKHHLLLPSFALSDNTWRSDRMSFTGGKAFLVDEIRQVGGETAWTTFILDKSNGFTRPGVERLNDSIRTYVWAILGAQAQTRSSIVGEGTAFDAQKQFLANVEDSISSPVDLPSSIRRFQNVLKYASSKVDYVYGFGLYMAPSDMSLHMGSVPGYNNEIIIATDTQTIGLNEDINKPTTHFIGAVVKSRDEKPIVQSEEKEDNHEAEKSALIFGGVGVGLLIIWYFKH